VIMY